MSEQKCTYECKGKDGNVEKATGNNVRNFREHLGITQEEFAARIGADAEALDAWEKGRLRPGKSAIRAIKNLARKEGVEFRH